MIIVPNLAMRLLSIASLVKKSSAGLFLPRKEILIDVEDECAVLGCDRKVRDGLFTLMTIKLM